MTTTIQHNPVLLQQSQNKHTEDEDVALANFITNSIRFDQPQEIWNYNQQQQYFQPRQRTRSRASSNTSQPNRQIQVQKSISTPNRQGRPLNSRTPIKPRPVLQEQDRRPSLTGSITSVQSDMSLNTKLSLSKRLRKVFSMSSLRGSSELATLAERNDSSTSIDTSVDTTTKPLETDKKPSFRRRSIASLSSLFQKGETNLVKEENIKEQDLTATKKTKEQDLTSTKKPKEQESITTKKPKEQEPTTTTTTTKKPKEQNSISNKKSKEQEPTTPTPNTNNNNNNNNPHHTKKPGKVDQNKKGALKVRSSSSTHHSPDSPTNSRTSQRIPEQTDKPVIGFHYGMMGLHQSPRLKPAASTSSTSSLVTTIARGVQFSNTVQVNETFNANDYDRRCDNNSTCQKLTPVLAMKIKQELNEYKLSEMEVHIESRQYTHFFL